MIANDTPWVHPDSINNWSFYLISSYWGAALINVEWIHTTDLPQKAFLLSSLHWHSLAFLVFCCTLTWKTTSAGWPVLFGFSSWATPPFFVSFLLRPCLSCQLYPIPAANCECFPEPWGKLGEKAIFSPSKLSQSFFLLLCVSLKFLLSHSGVYVFCSQHTCIITFSLSFSLC